MLNKMIESDCQIIIFKVLQNAFEYPIFNLTYGSSPASDNKIGQLAKTFINELEKDKKSLKECSNYLFNETARIVEDIQVLQTKIKEGMWKKILRIANKNHFKACLPS